MVSNAGGVNPQACVAALLQAARDQGLEISVATVTGDDFTDRVCISYSLYYILQSYSLLVFTSILIFCILDGGCSNARSTGDDHWTFST